VVSQFASAGAMAGTLDHSVPVQEVIETCQEFPAQRISATLIVRSCPNANSPVWETPAVDVDCARTRRFGRR
jgi:hypothetical protein